MQSPQNWNPSILTAFIGALALLIVSLIQVIFHRRNTKIIENLKARLDRQGNLQGEYLRHYLEYVIEGKGRELEAFKDLLQHVQILRDKVRSITRNPDSFDTTTLQRELRDLSQHIVESFARNQAHFVAEDWKDAHILKNKCKEMVDEVLSYLSRLREPWPSQLPARISNRQEEIAVLQAKFRERAFIAAKSFTDSLKARASSEDEIE
jgi:hypothetical protein